MKMKKIIDTFRKADSLIQVIDGVKFELSFNVFSDNSTSLAIVGILFSREVPLTNTESKIFYELRRGIEKRIAEKQFKQARKKLGIQQ